MKKKSVLHTILLGTICVGLSAKDHAHAQSVDLDPGGLQMSLGIAQRFETGRNLQLDVPEEGHGSIASTILSFGLSSETPIQSIGLDAVTALRWSNLPNQGGDFDIGDSILDFDFNREGANAGLEFDADYSSYDIGFLRSLTVFVDEEGVIDLPTDFDDLTGDGTRREYNLSFGMDFGRQDLVGYFFRLERQDISYVDQTNPDLFDQDTNRATVGLSFLLSPVTTATIEASAERFREDDPDQRDRRTTDILFGVSHELTAQTRAAIALGYADVDERRSISPDIQTSGPIGRVFLEHDVPNGSYTFEIETEIDTPGRLSRLRVGHSRDVLGGVFEASLGVAEADGGITEPIGTLSYTQVFNENELRVFFDRNVVYADEDDFSDEYILDVGYIWGLGPSSRLGLGATQILTNDVTVDPRIDRTELNAVYSYELESNWVINTGLNYRIRDEEGLGESKSPLVFFAIGREFAWRP